MPVDYSKWDALELSDDSDIEVHPNVDKRSFIRAKQNQIHQQRYERRNQIETLKYERIINDGLLQRIDTLLAALRSHEAEATNADDFFMQNLLEIARDPRGDEPPAPPQGVHSKSEQPRYSQMMASLIDQVKQEVRSTPSDGWSKAYIEGVEQHEKKVIGLQKELVQKLGELEAEEARKITSDSIHTGFNRSLMAKDEPKPKPKSKPPAKTVEVLNPNALNQDISRMNGGQSPGADADVDEPLKATQDADEEELAELTPLSRAFSQIKPGDYNASRRFILENREVVAERETDALLVEAFNALTNGKKEYGRQCIHQGLLLQYCRSLGRDGVEIFFKRINTPGHQAQKLFLDDVNTTYERILKRTAELAKSTPGQDGPEVEQIQLHAVDPSTKIHINIPQPGSTDPIEIAAREIFERFPPGLQRALESGELARVNEVLGKMSVSEAEEVVEQLGEGGMLSLEEGVIDGTTEEGREKFERLEREARAAREGKDGDENDENEHGFLDGRDPGPVDRKGEGRAGYESEGDQANLNVKRLRLEDPD